MKETLKRSADSARDSLAESENGAHETGKVEKYGSPAVGSCSSAEDESGFSSMNSFQDVGLPLVHCEDVAAGKSTTPFGDQTDGRLSKTAEDAKLWQKPFIYHQRRNSSPIVAPKQKSALKVLWV